MKKYGCSELIAILKQKRKENNISLEEISKQLNIRKKYLKALENGNDKEIPGAVYMQGYIKMYARYFSLDLSEYELDNTQTPSPQLSANSLPSNETQKPSKLLLFLSLISLIAIGWMYNYFHEDNPVKFSASKANPEYIYEKE